MEQRIYIRQILELVNAVFGINQSTAAELIDLDKSQMTNAVKGRRKIKGIDLETMFLGPKLHVPTDKDQDKNIRPFTTSRMISELKSKGLLYPDIEQAADKGYIAVISAIMSHYQPGAEKLNTYDESKAKGKEYFNNGNYKEALKHYIDAEKHLQGDREKEMELYELMADVYLKLGEYARAIGLYAQALDICIFTNGEDDFKTAKLYECMGFVLRKDKRYKEAKLNFKNAESILSKKLERNPDDHEVAKLYNNIGLMYLNEKDFDKARNYYEKSYAIRENNYKRFGDEEEGFYVFEFAYSVHNMGTLHNKIVTDRIKKMEDSERTEHLNKAVEFHKRAYEMRLELLKGEDIYKVIKRQDSLTKVCKEIAQSLTLWASDLAELGDYKTALEKCEQGLKIREGLYGKGAEIQDIAWSFYTMGIINDKLGKYEKSLENFRESYRIRFKVCNGDHPYAAKALFQMGCIKYTLMHTDALLDLNKAYAIQKETLKEDDPELLATIEWIEKIKNKR